MSQRSMGGCRKKSPGARLVVNQLTADTLRANLYQRTGYFVLLY